MTELSDTTWQDILAQVKLNHPELVRGWFTGLRPGPLEQGVLEIMARNGAQKRYLERHCRVALAEAAQAATGRLVALVFEAIDNDAEPVDSSNGFDNDADSIPLNPHATFDNFVTGPCNRLAHAAAVAVSDDPGKAYNPFFVYGPVGLGKTHLLQAVCHTVSNQQPSAQVRFLSCESFVNHFIEAVENGALHQFRYRYRHVDVLVIDDIQFLAERERSQEEFFHTFNTLYQSHRQIILSADCCPSEIPSLEERLVSRFNSGLVALLDRPCLETRMAILRTKAKLRCIEVPEDVIRLVAQRIDSNIRELEGALIKLDALSHTEEGRITLEMAADAFGTDPQRPVRIGSILETVSNRFNVKVSEIQGKKRSKHVTHPRHVCMYLARQLTTQSLEQIGGYFGGRDHTTVLHASRSIERQAKQDPELAELLTTITQEVRHAT